MDCIFLFLINICISETQFCCLYKRDTALLFLFLYEINLSFKKANSINIERFSKKARMAVQIVGKYVVL